MSADKVVLLIVDHVLHGFKCLAGLDVIADVHPDLGVFRPRAAKHHQADVTEQRVMLCLLPFDCILQILFEHPNLLPLLHQLVGETREQQLHLSRIRGDVFLDVGGGIVNRVDGIIIITHCIIT